MTVRVAFLDRDGTINVDHGYVHRWDQWQFVPGALDGLRQLHEAGFSLAIVSNQSGIARQLYSERDVIALHEQMKTVLSSERIPIAAIAYCPHASEDRCLCRKPEIGLARQVAQQIGGEIDYGCSWTIGDKVSDLRFGQALGTKTALLHSRYWTLAELVRKPDLVADDLNAAARMICEKKD